MKKSDCFEQKIVRIGNSQGIVIKQEHLGKLQVGDYVKVQLLKVKK